MPTIVACYAIHTHTMAPQCFALIQMIAGQLRSTSRSSSPQDVPLISILRDFVGGVAIETTEIVDTGFT